MRYRLETLALFVAVGGALAFISRAAVCVLFFFVSLMALREFITITYTRRADHVALVLAFFFFLPFQYFLIWIEWYGFYSILIPVCAFLAMPLVAVLSRDSTRFLERVAKVQWGLMICVFCLSHVPALLNLRIPGYEGREALLIVFLAAVAQGSEVLRHAWGRLPGGLAAVALGGALYWITPFNAWQASLMSLAIVVLGFFGGRVMAAIKRDRGIRDWGAKVEGHGGMLDRLESVCFAAPIFFHATRFFFEP